MKSIDISQYKSQPLTFLDEIKDKNEPEYFIAAIEICKFVTNPVDSSLVALKYLKRLRKANYEIDCSTYSTLINLFYQNKFYEQIFELYDQMKLRKYGPFDEFTWCNLMDGIAKVSRPKEIEEILVYIKTENFPMTISMYNIVFSLYSKRRVIIRLLTLLKEALSTLKPNNETVYYILEAFLLSKDKRFEQFYYGMLDKVEIERNTKSLFLKCLCFISNDFDKSYQFLKELDMPTKEEYHDILKCCVTNNNLKRGLFIIKEMKEKFTLEIDSYNHILEILANLKDPRVFDLFESLKNTNTESYHALIKYCALIGDIEKGKGIIHEMKENEIPTNVITFNLLTGPLFRSKWKIEMDRKMII